MSTTKNGVQVHKKYSPILLQLEQAAQIPSNRNIEKETAYLELIHQISSTSAIQCLSGKQVSLLRKEDQGALDRALQEAVLFANATVNVKEKMNSFQVADAVNAIQGEYPFLKIEEIVKAINNGRTGRYGQIYRLDVGVICSWIDGYCQSDRVHAVEESHRLQHKPNEDKPVKISEEKLAQYRARFDAQMNKILVKKNMAGDRDDSFNESVFVEQFINNLPTLTDEALKEWKKSLSKSGDQDLLGWVESEISHRKQSRQ